MHIHVQKHNCIDDISHTYIDNTIPIRPYPPMIKKVNPLYIDTVALYTALAPRPLARENTISGTAIPANTEPKMCN